MTEKEVLKIDKNWNTLRYEKRKVGHAEISTSTYKPGYYLMEGIDGYLYFEVTEPIQVTSLKIFGGVVMVDDPFHWIGMKRIAEACYGKVLIGGLGLGIILHHLKNNNEVTRIIVCEIDKDVVELVGSFLPDDSRVMILCEDVFKFSTRSFDVIVLDVLVKGGSGFKRGFSDIRAVQAFQQLHYDKKVYIWGVNDSKYNPGYCPSHEIEKRLERIKEDRKKRRI